MVDYGCFKTKLKGEKQRSDEGQTKIRRGTDEDQTKYRRRSNGEKNMDDIHRPYLIQRVLAQRQI